MITLTPCASKMLEAHGYDATTKTLAVRFGPEKVYHYRDVPPDVYATLCAAESVGASFAKRIRGKFDYDVILDEQPETALETSE